MSDNGGFGLSPHINTAGGVRRRALDAIDSASVERAGVVLGDDWRSRPMLTLDVKKSAEEIGAAADRVAEQMGIWTPPEKERAPMGTWVQARTGSATVIDNWQGEDSPPGNGSNKNYRWRVRLLKCAWGPKGTRRSISVADRDKAEAIAQIVSSMAAAASLWRSAIASADDRTRSKALELTSATMATAGLGVIDHD